MSAEQLTAVRKAAGKTLSVRIMEELRFLDMEKVRFEVGITPLSGENGDG